jgi:hypothetical protein
MTTEVEGTCVAVEHKDEADWAMEYAAENRRRVTAERRYAAAIYAAGGLIKSVDDLITAMFETNLQVKAPENLAFFKQAARVVMESEPGILQTSCKPGHGVIRHGDHG